MQFPVTSRYHEAEIAVLEWETGDHEPVNYLRRRFLPPLEGIFMLGEHLVEEGERLDHLATRYLGDPELFWRLCDANTALRPEDLTSEINRPVRIPLIQGG